MILIKLSIINCVTCLLKPSTLQPLERKTLVTSNTEFHNRYELLQSARCATATKKKVQNLWTISKWNMLFICIFFRSPHYPQWLPKTPIMTSQCPPSVRIFKRLHVIIVPCPNPVSLNGFMTCLFSPKNRDVNLVTMAPWHPKLWIQTMSFMTHCQITAGLKKGTAPSSPSMTSLNRAMQWCSLVQTLGMQQIHASMMSHPALNKQRAL